MKIPRTTAPLFSRLLAACALAVLALSSTAFGGADDTAALASMLQSTVKNKLADAHLKLSADAEVELNSMLNAAAAAMAAAPESKRTEAGPALDKLITALAAAKAQSAEKSTTVSKQNLETARAGICPVWPICSA